MDSMLHMHTALADLIHLFKIVKAINFVLGFISLAMDAKRLEKPTTQNNINFLRIKLSAKSIGSFQSITKDFFDQSERTFLYQSEFGPPDINF